MNKEKLKEVAEAHGWTFTNPQPDGHYIRFTKGEKILDIWHTLTARFIPHHNIPWGKAVYYRDNSEEKIEELLRTL